MKNSITITYIGDDGVEHSTRILNFDLNNAEILAKRIAEGILSFK